MIQEKRETLKKGVEEIIHVSSAVNLSEETIAVAKKTYKDAVKDDGCEFTGRSVELIAYTALLIATRKTGEVRTAKEIADAGSKEVDASSILRTHKYLCETLDLGLVLAQASDFVDRIATVLELTEDEVQRAKEIITAVEDVQGIQNKGGKTIAGAVVYYVGSQGEGHGKYTQEEIAESVDITALTVRKNYRDVKDIVDEE